MIAFDFCTEETDKKSADLIKLTRQPKVYSLVLKPQTMKRSQINTSLGSNGLEDFGLI